MRSVESLVKCLEKLDLGALRSRALIFSNLDSAYTFYEKQVYKKHEAQIRQIFGHI